MDKQADLSSFGVPKQRTGPRRQSFPYPMMYDEPSLADDSCPWCLAPPSEFKEQLENRPGEVVCMNCHTIVPVHMDWYQRGEKIVI